MWKAIRQEWINCCLLAALDFQPQDNDDTCMYIYIYYDCIIYKSSSLGMYFGFLSVELPVLGFSFELDQRCARRKRVEVG